MSVKALFMRGRDGGRGDMGRDIGVWSVAINGTLSCCAMIMGQSCGTCRGLAGVVSIRLAPDLRRSRASRWGASPGRDSRGEASRRTRGWRPRGGVRRALRTHGEYRRLQIQDAENDTIGEAWA